MSIAKFLLEVDWKISLDCIWSKCASAFCQKVISLLKRKALQVFRSRRGTETFRPGREVVTLQKNVKPVSFGLKPDGFMLFSHLFWQKSDTNLTKSGAKSLKSWVALQSSTNAKSFYSIFVSASIVQCMRSEAYNKRWFVLIKSCLFSLLALHCKLKFCEFSFLDPSFFPVVPRIQFYHLLKKGTKEERNTTWELLQAKANLGSLSTLTKSISTIPNVVLLYILTQSERKGLLKFEDLMNKLRFLSDSSKIGDKERHKFQVQSFKRCNDSTCDQGTIYSVIQLLLCCYPLQRAFYQKLKRQQLFRERKCIKEQLWLFKKQFPCVSIGWDHLCGGWPDKCGLNDSASTVSIFVLILIQLLECTVFAKKIRMAISQER